MSLKKIAKELNSVPSNNIVKIAGVAKKIVNWFKGFNNPEFQKKLQQLQEISPEIKGLVDNLSFSIDQLNKALSNTDPEGFGKALEAVKPLVSELSTKLETLDDQASDVISSAPVDAVIDDTGKIIQLDSVKNLEKGWFKNKQTLSEMKSLLPESLDVPIGRNIDKNLKDFQWFQQFTTNDIRISSNASAWIIDAISKLIYDAGELTPAELNATINYLTKNKSLILNSLKEGIMNGVLRAYTFPSSGQPNKMHFVVDAGIIKIPGLGFDIQFPTVFMRDKFTTLMPIKELEVESFKNVRAIKDNTIIKEKPDIDENLIRLVLEKNNYNISQSARELGTSDRTLKRRMQDLGIDKPQQEKIEPQLLQELEASLNEEFIKQAANREVWAYPIVQKAFRSVMGREPSEAEIQAVMAVARLETSYGFGWKGNGVGSNNWGAIQCGDCKVNGRCNPQISFTHKDSSPQEDGTNKWYTTCFKKYRTPEEGAADLVYTLFKSKVKSFKGGNPSETRGERLLNAVQSGDLNEFSAAMYDTSYYEGYGKTRDERIGNHMKAMNNALTQIAKNTGKQSMLSENSTNAFDQKEIDSLFQFLAAAAPGPLEKIVKTAVQEMVLPKSRYLIVIGSKEVPIYNRVRFAQIVSSALRQELGAECSVHNYNDKIEVEADIVGTTNLVKNATNEFVNFLSSEFGTNIDTKIIANAKSKYNLIDSEFVEESFRKYAFEVNSK